MKRISTIFDFPDDISSGLGFLIVDKVDYYTDKGIVALEMRGIDEVTSDTPVYEACSLIRKGVGCDVRISFSDCKENDVVSYITAMSKYIMRTAGEMAGCSLESCDGREASYEIRDNTLYVSFDKYLYIIIEDPSCFGRIGDAMVTLINGMFGSHITSCVTGRAEEEEKNEPFDAISDGELPFESSYAPERELDMIREKLREEEEARKKAKAEKPVNKDSWEYKAKEQRKEARAKQKTEKSDFKKVKNTDSVIGKVRSGVMNYDIKDVTEDLRTVNIRGFLQLKDDLRVSKNGNCVVAKFVVFDKTGGIGGIGFIKPEEADLFEKMFKKGSYCGVQGDVSMEYGELNLRLSGIFEAEPPAGRSDNAPVKRVELHVHSKMSESDAVSDPDKIMKLAAKFGHPACAITDHGVVQAFPLVYNTAMSLKVGKTDEPFKSILGCEAYLVDDGPTAVYNLPTEEADRRHIGSFVSVAIETTGNDGCTDLITKIAATKYRLRDYRGIRPAPEGESDESAMEFAMKDIDRSLWSEDEIPEPLKDQNLPKPKSVKIEEESHVINVNGPVEDIYDEEDREYVPDTIVFDRVADFYAEVEDQIYKGEEMPFDSYFRVGELLDFIGGSYITGDDIFRVLDFLRRAGFGINVVERLFYRHKFLMPAICIEDLCRYLGPCDAVSSEETGNKLLDKASRAAGKVASALVSAGTVDPYVINERIGHLDLESIKDRKISPAYHIILLVRNMPGLYDLYRLVSEAHTTFFPDKATKASRPRTPKSLLKYYSSGIIIGGACERGEIYREVIKTYKQHHKDVEATKTELLTSERFSDIMSLYDYVEIQPLCNNMFMTREQPGRSEEPSVPLDENDIRIMNELLVWAADAFGKPCAATTDSHFLEKEDGMYRKHLLMSQGFADAELQSDLYFRTTDEMLDEFSYLGEEKAYEVVVTNTNLIADKIEYGIKPFPGGTYPPIISRAAADVRDIAYTCANRMYRHNGVIDPVVKQRLDKELSSIISHGYAIMYYIAYRLVKKSNNDGYIVGSRGSVGSSFVATMCGISEVNPLAPHYRCPKCNLTEFNDSGEYGSGFDLPPKDCPDCGIPMIKDGQDIPFETFLGFDGDKEPDIDLNFSGVYQPTAHQYVEYLFGHSHTFRAGTVQGYEEKNADGIGLKVGELRGIRYSHAMMNFMTKDIIGVKKTTGQHPGGIVVVPKEMDVYDFTPIQYPANKKDSGTITTHFDFNALHDTILKLDILGHKDPTVLRMLQVVTGKEINDIPIPDEKVMSLLESTDVLGFPIEETEAGSATLGLPELGTKMARGMIKEAKPRRFYDLVQLMGLSHGTDVWTGNAQDLIRDGICDLNSVIGCRDSIMTRLIHWGLPNFDSFMIMEKVRKGKGLTPEQESLMREHDVPDWYINSCKKIKYMFPKAHAAAYSISSLRVAWFKVYMPEEYYCAFLTVRGTEFHAQYMMKGREVLRNRRLLLDEQIKADPNPKKKLEYYLCELIEEMDHRGIEFLPFDINKSHPTDFVKEAPGKIRPPLDMIDRVNGEKIVKISQAQAEAIAEARKDGPFANRADLMDRSGIGQAAMDILVEAGVLDDLPETSQIDIFSFLGGE